jgi:hypothetical protein
MASLRPAESYNTPPCGTGKFRPPLGVSGWPRSSSYPGHQYDSMIEDVVQQMLNESSPDGPPPLALVGTCATAAPREGPDGAPAPRAMGGVTDLVGPHASPASGSANEPLPADGALPQVPIAAGATQSLQQASPCRSIYLASPTGKRCRSTDAEEPGAVGGACGGDSGDSPSPGDGASAAADGQPPISGHRRRPRKAARVDGGGGSAAAAVAATAAAAAGDRMQPDELSKLRSDESDSDEDMLDSYAAGGTGRGSGRQTKEPQGMLRGGPGRGPGSMFAGKGMPYGSRGGGNWMKPGLAWSRTAGAGRIGTPSLAALLLVPPFMCRISCIALVICVRASA